MTKLVRRIGQVATATALAAGGLVGFGQPASAALHTCNGTEEFVSATTGARVCFYSDTWTFKICDTRSDTTHPGASVIWSGTERKFNETPGFNHCGSEHTVPFLVEVSIQAVQYSSSNAVLSRGQRVAII